MLRSFNIVSSFVPRSRSSIANKESIRKGVGTTRSEPVGEHIDVLDRVDS